MNTPALVWAIARREYASMFRVPVGWVVIALFLLLTGAIFERTTLIPGQPASLRYFFGPASMLLLALAPAVSMRLLAEEARSGTLETLVTSPAGQTTIILGKFLGGYLFLLTMLAATLAYPLVLIWASNAAPDPGPIVAGYLALALIASLYLAVGTLASALTSNQTLAFVVTLLALLLLMLAPPMLADRLPASALPIIDAVSLQRRLADFSRGILDTGHVAFYVLTSAFALTLAGIALDARRWR